MDAPVLWPVQHCTAQNVKGKTCHLDCNYRVLVCKPVINTIEITEAQRLPEISANDFGEIPFLTNLRQ
jgi:hypothetical protein